ncbi:MAG: molybdopterin molybdotransferase MoeA [Rubrivivax sp.]|nr:molybdopterin molybdotransferase MoeA [Rubrivivax sp.]
MSELGPSPLAVGDLQLGVDEARRAILSRLVPVDGVERVRLPQALGRVLAEDVISPIDVPPHDNSAMDGYAFDGAALRDDAPLTLAVVGTAFAGPVGDVAAGPGQCVRIMTGAVMPPGLDTVVPQELVTVGDAGRTVTLPPGVIRAGENRRRRGEDLAQGRPAIAAGRRLRPADIGLAASLGFDFLVVRRRLRVAIFSTGDEIRPPGEPLPAGCIYDSNRYTLTAALQSLGVEVLDLGIVRDEPGALQAAFDDAVRRADAVLTSGGVSVGEADYTREMLARMGEVAFWKVAMRPGRPFAFGPLHGGPGSGHTAWLFALPGNPVAALVTFHAFVREALAVLGGSTEPMPPCLQARSVAAIRKRPGRTEYQRGIVSRGLDGVPEVRLTGSQGAGILRSLSEANALVVLGHEQGSVAAGAMVDVWMFDGLL